MENNEDTRERVLDVEEAAELTNLSPSTLRRLEDSGEFPKRRSISSQRVGWLYSDVCEWLNNRPVIERHKKKESK